jgi:hypothetical protein
LAGSQLSIGWSSMESRNTCGFAASPSIRHRKDTPLELKPSRFSGALRHGIWAEPDLALPARGALGEPLNVSLETAGSQASPTFLVRVPGRCVIRLVPRIFVQVASGTER